MNQEKKIMELNMNSELIEVYVDWKNLQGPVLVGLLRFEEPLGK